MDATTRASLAALPSRERLVCVIHSLPTWFEEDDVKNLVRDKREISGTIFVPELHQMFYHRFSEQLYGILDALEAVW